MYREKCEVNENIVTKHAHQIRNCNKKRKNKNECLPAAEL